MHFAGGEWCSCGTYFEDSWWVTLLSWSSSRIKFHISCMVSRVVVWLYWSYFRCRCFVICFVNICYGDAETGDWEEVNIEKPADHANLIDPDLNWRGCRSWIRGIWLSWLILSGWIATYLSCEIDSMWGSSIEGWFRKHLARVKITEEGSNQTF